jgi:tetratricopeptide (TPR) repeat protein
MYNFNKKLIAFHPPAHHIYPLTDAAERRSLAFLYKDPAPHDLKTMMLAAFPSDPNIALYLDDNAELERKIFAGQHFKPLDHKGKISYRIPKDVTDLSTLSPASKKVTLREMVIFLVHVTSLQMHADVEAPEDSIADYQRLGLVSAERKSTTLFRQSSLIDFIQIGQSRWDGMPSKLALILMCYVTNQLRLSAAPIAELARKYRDQVVGMLGLKEQEDRLIHDLPFRGQVAKSLLKIPASQARAMQAGHVKHAFYLSFHPLTAPDKLGVDIVIHNFNGFALLENKEVEPGANYFYPVVIRFETQKLVGPRRRHNKLAEESRIFGDYISVVVIAHNKTGKILKDGGPLKSVVVPGEPILQYERRVLDHLKKFLFEHRKPLFEHYKASMKTDTGEFCGIDALRGILDWADFQAFLQATFPDVVGVHNLELLELNQHYVFEWLQNILLLYIIYHPEEFYAGGFFQPGDHTQFPPYSLQRTGNCTVFNMKAALACCAGIDSRTEAGFEAAKDINLHLQYQTHRLTWEFAPGLSAKIKATAPATVSLPLSPAILRLNEGAKHFTEGRLAAAKASYHAAIAIDRDNPEPYARLGIIAALDGSDAEAVEHFDQAILRTKSDFRIYVNRAISLAKLGRLDEALSDFARAISLNPFDTYAYHNRALVYIQMGEIAKAVKDYDSIAEIDPTDPEPYYNVAQLYANVAHTFPLSIRLLNKALELRSDYSEALELRGKLLELVI